MRRFILLLLTFILLASLAGCGSPSPAPAPVAAEDDLTPVLEEIAASVQPGTAGSSLKAAQAACHLMDWSIGTQMDMPAIRETVERFLAGKNEEDQSLFSEQLISVNSAARYLKSEDGTGLLEDIGGPEGTLWPWENAPTEKIDAVLEAGHASDSEG